MSALASEAPQNEKEAAIDRERPAYSPTTSPEDLRALSRSEEVPVRRSALMNPNLPVDELRAVFEVGILDDQVLLLGNPSLPTDLVGRLVAILKATPDTPQREGSISAAVQHPSASRRVLVQAIQSQNLSWLAAAAFNPNLPDDLAAALFLTQSATIRRRMLRTVSVTMLTAHSWELEENTAIIEAVLLRTFHGPPRPLSPETFQRLVDRLWVLAEEFGERGVLANVARLTRNPEQLLALCGNKNFWLRSQAAGNAHCPEEGLVLVALLNAA